MGVNFEENFEVKNLTTFKIGGKVKKIYFPQNIAEFKEIITPDAKVFGQFSNTLVSTNGFSGTIISTAKMNEIKIDGNKVYAECGVKGPLLAKVAAQEGLSGLEFMIGFPGSVGGNVYMNASACSQAVSDIVKNITVYSKEKGVFTLTQEEAGFSYRNSICQNNDYIVLAAEFELKNKPREEIDKKMTENLEFRKNHQPNLTLPNAGSVFKNPDGDSAGRLLDLAGVKDLCIGGVQVWENHANFIVNNNNGTSDDVIELMIEMQKRVRDRFSIELKPEIVFLGNEEVELWK